MLEPNGKTTFHGLQEALSGSEQGRKIRPVYFVFDLLFVDGSDTAKMRTEERKTELKNLLNPLAPDNLVRYSDHVLGQGPEFLATGLEGIISKRTSAPYRPGRTTDWLKSKAVHREEFVVCGFILREGTKDQVGSLILGVRSTPGPKGQWVPRRPGRHRFHARGGARTAHAEEDGNEGFSISRTASRPWQGPLGPRRTTPVVPQWTTRELTLVCEVAFTEWTPEGTLRHPSFHGLREDKDPKGVIKEGQ